MSWNSAVKKVKDEVVINQVRPTLETATVDWARLVTVDFETYYDTAYTLSKLSTSEYIRDPRFKAQQVGIKIGDKPTKVYGPKTMKAALARINWSTHSVLCHNCQFDSFILHHHFGIKPAYYYDTLSMARGLHSNEIGASLNDVAEHYGKGSKIEGALEQTKGILDWPKALYDRTAEYCAQDVDLTYAIFKEMHAKYPVAEIEMIDLTMRMFCDPVLKVDIPRVEKELARELAERERKFYAAVNPRDWDGQAKELLKTKVERELQGVERDMLMIKRVIGSNDRYAKLLRAEGIEPPVKISPAWMKKAKADQSDEDKYTYAFAKDDLDFINIPADIDQWCGDLDPENPDHVGVIATKQQRLEDLIECRLAVKSTTNITRAERFLIAGADNMPLPVGYAYYRAHTGRFGGNNKMNMQNLQRGGGLRQSILAPKGYQLAVQDSGQIEARVNGWLWGQEDLLVAFRMSDAGIGSDAYCNFASLVYGRPITKADKDERFLGKVCLGPDTRVLTNRGLISIIDVSTTDLLWDGESWVKHDGLVDQGKKPTLTYRGLTATADHEILTGRGWLAWSEVLTDRSHFHSALDLAVLLSSGGSITPLKTESFGGTAQSVDVPAEQRTWSQPQTSETDDLLDVMYALRWQQVQRDIGPISTPWPTMSTEQDCLTDSRRLLQDVLTQTIAPTSTTVDGESLSIKNGKTIVRLFFDMCRHSLAGMSPSLRWTELTTTAGISQGTFDLLPSLSTRAINVESRTSNSESAISKQTTQTYDLANAGPNHRFTVMTDDGPVIVHNCVLGLGYSMGADKFQMTLAKGALGGPPIHLSKTECQRIVNLYRRANYKIVQGWDKCKEIIGQMYSGRAGAYKCIAWEKERIWLPNGMSLKYPDLKTSVDANGWDAWSYQSGDVRKKIYGGLLCENLVQALARIIVMGQMMYIAKKYRVVMTTHDEVVSMPKTAQAETCLKHMYKCMTTAPAWCSDIPLNAEGGWAANYSK